MEWIALIIAGFFEMFGVLMIHKLHNNRDLQPLLLLVFGFGARFVCLAYAMSVLPMGTAYAIWTGIGASGGKILGMVLYDEAKDVKRMLFNKMVLGTVVALKIGSKLKS